MTLKERLNKFKNKFKKEKKVLEGTESVDKVYSSENIFKTEQMAKDAFPEAKKRLFSIHLWNTIPGPGNATFALFDKNGQPYSAPKPSEDDYIKIVLPGPFPPNWVQVTRVRDEKDIAEFTVRPSTDPTDKGQPDHITEHFFKSQATSTFKVSRARSKITAFEIGKNEAINKRDTESGGRGAVNTLISEGGWAGFQKIQWKNLTDFITGV